MPIKRMTCAGVLACRPVATKSGDAVLLRDIATVTPGTAVGEYDRYNMQRTVSLTSNVEREDLGSAAAKIKSAMASAGAVPSKISVALRGQVAPMEQMFSSLQNGLLLAVVIIFLLLAANFQSVRLSFAVVST